MSLQPGDIVDGKYRIVRLLGEGGMGAVYEGENARIHRRVAIKVLHAEVAGKADVVQRFEREAQAAGRIGSEHIVEVLDLGSLPGGERYMVMEFLEGESLGERIERKGRLGAPEVAVALHQLLEGLAGAHQAGIIHRDLKPDNVFLVKDKRGQADFVKVLDFGVSKFEALEGEMHMTRTGAVMGTPYYMSPEQARGQKVDARSDLYSAGVVAYEALTGRVPFKAETFNELVFKIALESPEPVELLVPGIDPGFAAIVAHAMVRDPAARFQSARELQDAVGRWMASAGITPEGFTPPPDAPSIVVTGAHGPVPALSQTVQVPPPAPSRGRIVAIALVAVAGLSGGSFGAYRLFGATPAAPAPSVTDTAVVSAAPSAPPAPSATVAPTASASAAPASPEPPVSATASASAAPVASAAPGLRQPWPKPKASAKPVAPGPATPIGRTIGGEL